MRKTIVENNTLLTDEESYNTDRIEDIVKASDLLRNLNQEENSVTNNTNKKSLLQKLFYPYSEQYPNVNTYASKGNIIDIQFDEQFEQNLQSKNIIDLVNNENLPKDITLKIKPNNNDSVFTKNIKLNKDKNEFKNIINYYGDGHLDNLISKSVLIKPVNTKSQNYDIVVPKNTATSKLTILARKISYKYIPKTKEYKQIKFFASNISRTIINVIQLALIYTMGKIIYDGQPSHMNQFEYYEAILFASTLFVIFITMLQVLSYSIYLNSNNGNKIIGAFEYGIYIHIRNFVLYIASKLNIINKKIGNKININ